MVKIMKKNRKMQNIGYLMFVIGAAGVGGDDMLKAGMISLAGLMIIGVSALVERRKIW